MRISDWSSDVCSSDLDDARTLAEATGLQVARAVIRERSSFRAAWPYGLGVIEHEPEGKAALEIAALRDFIFEYLQIIKRSEERRVGKECDSPFRFRWSLSH